MTMQDKMTKNDLLAVLVDGVVNKLLFYVEDLGFNIDDAVQETKKISTAGDLVFQLALQKIRSAA